MFFEEKKPPQTFNFFFQVTFDRESRKTYSVPIRVCDRKQLCAVDRLTVTIGDENDNPMEPGTSQVFAYNYEGR